MCSLKIIFLCIITVNRLTVCQNDPPAQFEVQMKRKLVFYKK